RLEVTLCSSGDLPKHLVYGARPAVLYVREPRLISEAGVHLPEPRPLAIRDDLIQLGSPRGPACVRYDVDLAGALQDGRLLLACAAREALVTSTELFLWRPPRRAANLQARARFELPEGQSVSVPWPERDGIYVLDESAFSFTGHAMFGRFERRRVSVPAGELRLDTPAGFSPERLDWIETWLANAGRVVSLATGRFPLPDVQVIVLPTPAAAFRFGHTGRSGGASILLFMPGDVELESLREDWIAIHEFSHLLHPFVRREDAWLSEGLATYLQEVLRVRAGMLKAEDAWQRMYEGAALGRDAPGDLASETLRMAYAPNYQTVYWAGAAIALMADVELRRRTGGKASLDTALAALAQRRELMATTATAQSLIDALDRVSGQTAFRDVAARYLQGEELPDLSALYGELGVRTAERAPLAWIRDAIMAPRLPRAELPLFAR
ncbi:MAG TPA: hypothetical protein VJR89_09940, partial [Polyangiales bacterium]|nr:hypothetical protein [Polyangiales bacterium]